jgi:lysophospholipase L1-like esterase
MKSISANRNNLIFEEIKLELEENFFAADGIHPSDLGYQLIAEFAFKGILNHVKNKGLIKS